MLARMVLTYAGADGEAHSGVTRPSCVRVTSQWPQGTEIRNVRQLSVMAQEEIDLIAAACGLPQLDPALLGCSIVVAGISDFTHVPPSSRLQAPDGTTIVVDMENRPCNLPSREIEVDHPTHGKPFKVAAKGKRGVTAWVEREGILRVGDKLRLHVPDQRSSKCRNRGAIRLAVSLDMGHNTWAAVHAQGRTTHGL